MNGRLLPKALRVLSLNDASSLEGVEESVRFT